MDYLRVRILMEYQSYTDECLAVAEWEELKRHLAMPDPAARIMTVCLYYAHVLATYKESKEVLAQVHGWVEDFAQTFLAQDGFVLKPEWFEWAEKRSLGFSTGGKRFSLWPWTEDDPEKMREARKQKHDPGFGVKEYVITLRDQSPDTFGVHAKWALGLERLLIPGSAVYLLFKLGCDLWGEDRVLLRDTLLNLHEYYRKVAPYDKLLGATEAVNTAMSYPKRRAIQASSGDAETRYEEENREQVRQQAFRRGQRRGYKAVFWGLTTIMALTVGAALGLTASLLQLPGGFSLTWPVATIVVFLVLRPRISAGLGHSLAGLEQDDIT